jgi:outer membrane protein OmpA-like peptidoglycan-associated protein
MKATASRSAWVAVSLVLGLVSCLSDRPAARRPPARRTAEGSVIGAATGAAVGALRGDDGRERRMRALIGAGIGALAGAAIGSYMDREEAELRVRIEPRGVGVVRLGDEIQLIVSSTLAFDADGEEIRAGFFNTLAALAIVLGEYNQTLVEISGREDCGDSRYQVLSERRAERIRSYLAGRRIQDVRISARGLCESPPPPSRRSQDRRTRNPRIEIHLFPLTE